MSSKEDDNIPIGEIDPTKVGASEEEILEMVQAHREHVLIQFAAQRSFAATLIPFQFGAGVHFWDLRGKKYLDFASQLFNLNLGHQHPRVVKAIQQQAEVACYIRPTTNTYAVRSRLAQRLAAAAPGDLNRVLFTAAGTDAVEYAVKMAKLVTGRDKVCTFYRSYHGSSLGARSFGGDSRNWPGGSALPGVFKVHNPYAYRCPFGYPEGNLDVYVKHVIDTIEYEGPEQTACLLVEPIAGYAGLIVVPPPGFFQRVAAYCRSKGILFIADEVMTGFGRTGKFLAIEHWEGVAPDMVTLAKGITNGAVPLGAVLVAERVAAHFDDRVLFAGLTYSGHPLAMAAGLATLEAFEEEGVLARCARTGEALREWLQGLKARHPGVVGEVRALGLLAAIELVVDPGTREAVDAATMAKIDQYLLQRGLYGFYRWSCIGICPPLTISEHDLMVGLQIIEDAIKLFLLSSSSSSTSSSSSS